ncbi:acyl-coenzyme A thioesterase 9, mitochondrial-like [Convolutriloba macropyga]|uniref:acyl-coenzyme A thioesterase 9, mitochondrial-like n=1 Tax=Convolutriloba macropyga TaxID=536237 RepID=UPI003F51CDAF
MPSSSSKLLVLCMLSSLRRCSSSALSSGRVGTIQEVRDSLVRASGMTEKWNASEPHRNVKVLDPIKDRSLLIPQPVSQSTCQFSIPVKSDLDVREKYVNFHGNVRVGKLLEDLDYGAVIAGYYHNKRDTEDDTFSMSLVTAAVDQMLIHEPYTIPDEGDLTLSARVTWVGTSSMEVTESVSQNDKPILNAKFLMVARHSRKDEKVPVNPLIVETEQEKLDFEDGEKAKEERIECGKSSLLRAPPNEEESRLIHKMFVESVDVEQRTFKRSKKSDSAQWMSDAILKSSILCFPEHRNLHNKIFGGYVMRKALEHSWSNALVASHSKIVPVFIDDISFRKPVSIGDLLFLSSQVTYTEGNLLLLRCHAEVRNPIKRVEETTNEFYFVFAAVDESGQPVPVPEVKPRSYAEFLLFLDGRRRFQRFQNYLKLNKLTPNGKM